MLSNGSRGTLMSSDHYMQRRLKSNASNASSHVTFPHSSQRASRKVTARFGVSVESLWTEGKQASAVNLPAGVAVGQWYFFKTSDFYTFNVIFSHISLFL